MLNCRTIKQIKAFKAENFKFVKARDLKYLCKLLDRRQLGLLRA
jgi:hypothetical protein